MPGPPSPLWRVTDRATFAALRTGSRARSGAVSVTYLVAPDGTPPRVAFQIGKRTGGAVVRNRIRRRLRAALRDRSRAGALPSGTYLLGAGAAAAEQPWAELQRDVAAAVAAATRRAPAGDEAR